MHHYSRIIQLCLVLLFLAAPVYADEPASTSHINEGANPGNDAAMEQRLVTLQIPIFSAHFAEIPVALVNEEPITLNELAQALESDDEKENVSSAGGTAVLHDVLQRIIASRLIVQEAENIGLDETDQVQSELEEFRINTLLKELINMHLEGVKPDPADVADVYQQLSQEVQLYTLNFANAADARQFREEVEAGDFPELADQYIKEGKAEGEKEDEYVKIKDLLPQVAQQVHSMKEGDISTVYRTEKGYLLFELIDTRFVEDPSVEKEASRIVLDTVRKQKAMEYSNSLTDKYVDFNEKLYNELDFNKDFDQLKTDERVLATVKGDVVQTITVADLAAKMRSGIFHGVEKARKLQMLNKKKDITMSNMLFRITGQLEAQRLGLDQTEEFEGKVTDFRRALLFKLFMEKVILPEVKLTPEGVRQYYDEHIDEYSSPAMLRINSLVFADREDAADALDKLHKGADFKWVSANVSNFVPPETEGVLPFDERLLSLSSLPSDLQDRIRDAKKGDSLLYADPEGKYFYVLYLEKIYPPEPQPFAQAKDAVAKSVFDMKAREKMAEWVAKLKEAYETKIFVTDLQP